MAQKMASPFEHGDVLLAEYPFTDHTSAKLRPVLVISVAEFNKGEDLVVVPISSSMSQDDPYGFPIADTSPAFRASGLKWSSSVKWAKPMTICKTVIQRWLGRLPNESMTEIIDKISGMLRPAPLLRR